MEGVDEHRAVRLMGQVLAGKRRLPGPIGAGQDIDSLASHRSFHATSLSVAVRAELDSTTLPAVREYFESLSLRRCSQSPEDTLGAYCASSPSAAIQHTTDIF